MLISISNRNLILTAGSQNFNLLNTLKIQKYHFRRKHFFSRKKTKTLITHQKPSFSKEKIAGGDNLKHNSNGNNEVF